MATINLITNLENKWGLSKDTQILKRVLENAGYSTCLGQWDRSPQCRKANLNIHLELVASRWFNHSPRNILVPNPEWFLDSWTRQARLRFDAIFCKTKQAVSVFTGLHFRNVVYTGFTSNDCKVEGIDREPIALHLAGNSLFKNTPYILKHWQKEWPLLHVFGSNPEMKKMFEHYKRANIVYHFAHVPDSEILTMLNRATWAIQPSRSEGFGHCIVEPLSAGCQVVSLDAPPMNEFGATQRLPAIKVGSHHYGLFFEPGAFNIDFNLRHDTRTWWEKNNEAFEERLLYYIKELLK